MGLIAEVDDLIIISQVYHKGISLVAIPTDDQVVIFSLINVH
jgi:hypothetical protein